MPSTVFSFLFTLLLATAVVAPASAANLKTATTKDGNVVVSLSGEIAVGDSDAFKAVVGNANRAGHLVSRLRLNSPGGNLLEGAEIADIVRFGKIPTSIAGSAVCASACFIIFAAGSEKSADYSARIGVHGASDENGNETADSGSATITMAKILRELGVPSAIIGKMVVTPPTEIVWLNPNELRSMGAVVTGRPAQLPSESVSNSSVSPQLKSTEGSIRPDDQQQPTWGSLIDSAMELSKSQNGGNADIGRVCQPELKVCINALSFKSKAGADMMMKVTEDLDGKVLHREVCSFNTYHDVRSCIDWDTGSSHRDMKNSKGEWQIVGNE